MIQKAVSSTMSLLLLILMGFLMGGTKLIKEHRGELVISGFLANWALPCFVFYNIYSSFEGRAELFALLKNIPVPFALIAIMLALGALTAKLLKIDRSRRGAFTNANVFSNTSFIGFPIVVALLGPQALPMAMMYYIANTMLFFTVGTWLLGRDSGKNEKLFTAEGLKKVFSPMVISLILGMAAKLVSLPLPDFVTTALSYFSSVCPCLGMIFVGIVIRRNKIDRSYFFPDITVLLVLKYIVTAAVIGIVLYLLPISAEAKAIFFILSMMPSITQMSIMSSVMGSDSVFCALWLTVSSTVGVAYVPILIYLAENVFHFIQA